MGRRKKRKLDMISKVLKPVLAASTHVFTISGVLVAASPLVRGLEEVKNGNLKGAPSSIVYDITGADINTGTQPQISKLITTGLVVATGIGLIAAGGLIRKRIGRTH